MKQIVIATDGSEGGRAAVETGLGLARSTGAAVTLLFVRAAPPPIIGDPLYQRALHEGLEKARAVLDEAEAAAAEAGVPHDTEILEGDPAKEIVQLARMRDADLIVVGSRGLGAVAGAMLGSVSNAVVHRADRPVLVAKPSNDRSSRAA